MYTSLATLVILAGTIFSEAGVEKQQGRQLVADTLYWRAERLQRRRLDLTRAECLRRAALKPRQYSCWDPGERRNATYAAIREAQMRDLLAWRDSARLAERLIEGTYVPTTRATHYYNPTLCRPYWAGQLRDTRRVGNHIAGRLP